MTRKKDAADRLRDALRKRGLTYPGAHLKSPWPTHMDLAVNDKTFCYLGTDGEPFSISCKLPHSSESALALPFTTPTGYGLGKSGWVTATPSDGAMPPLEMFERWIDESYRAQAPKRLVRELDGEGKASVAAKKGVPARRAGSARASKKSK